MVLQNLKQSNKPAFNFALASFVSLLFAVIGLVLLGQGLKEQKQIAKQWELIICITRISTRWATHLLPWP